MVNPNKHIFLLRKLPVVVVYTLFLAVQVFFNFDIGRKYFGTGSNVFYVNSHSSNTAAGAAKATAHSPSQGKLRLNKRFQPPVILCTIAEVSEINILHNTPVKLGSSISHNYSSIALSAHSRRGPPSVV